MDSAISRVYYLHQILKRIFSNAIMCTTIYESGANMELSFSQIKAVTLGACSVTQQNDGIYFNRFTDGQTELYKTRAGHVGMGSRSSSGVVISFKTDSKMMRLSFAALIRSGASDFFVFDVFVNGKKIGTVENSIDLEAEAKTVEDVAIGYVDKEFSLGDGEKHVKIYLPWRRKGIVRSIELDDGSSFEAVKPQKKLLCFGDSITQGVNASCPCDKYTTRIADYIGAEEFNKGVGGEIFFPELAAERDGFEPDIITVAYGTNDWSFCKFDEFKDNCNRFFENLNKNYPKTKTYAITPLWRTDADCSTDCGEFGILEKTIREATAKYENVTVISGPELIEHSQSFFKDHVHPNDIGFNLMADAINDGYLKNTKRG